nr:phospholipase-like protein [Tanacetum cinerariifolium]
MFHLSQLAADANSIQLTYIIALLFHNDNQRDCQLVWETYVSCQQLMVRCQERHEQILELQSLVRSNDAAESVRLLKEFQYDDLESTRGMTSFFCPGNHLVDVILRRCYLLLILERANVFQKKGIDSSKYTITFRLVDNVPKQGAYMVIVVCGDAKSGNKLLDDKMEARICDFGFLILISRNQQEVYESPIGKICVDGGVFVTYIATGLKIGALDFWRPCALAQGALPLSRACLLVSTVKYRLSLYEAIAVKVRVNAAKLNLVLL